MGLCGIYFLIKIIWLLKRKEMGEGNYRLEL